MSLTTACCTLPPVESNYIPIGKESSLGDLPLYETGDGSSNQLLICFYDIFGNHPNTKQFCDKLGVAGFRVVMPDFFRNQGFAPDNLPKDRSVIMAFVDTIGSWDKVVKNDMVQLLQHYKSQGVTGVGIFGFCWGGKMCVAGSTDFSKDVNASVLIHPSFVSTEDAEKVGCPTLSLPSKDEADMIPFNEIIQRKFGPDGSGHHKFGDMHHGFAGARGDLEDELNRKAVDEAIALSNNFFKKNLPQ